MARKKSKAKKSTTKKTKAKKAATVKKTARKSAAKRAKAPARKAAAKKTGKKAATKTAKRAAPRKAKNVAGEGSYTASRNFRKKQETFVKKNKAKIPAMGKEAEAALEGPQGAELQAAETEAAEHAVGVE
jgi:hypothetical protein